MPAMLVGNDVMDMQDARVARYNAALLIDPQGQVVNRYEKMHLVMFGEYIPLGAMLSFLGDAFGFSSMNRGESAKAFEVAGVVLAPSICFESMVPHLLSRQIRTLKAAGQNPDVLITITNDSWFRGSSLLDHHLASEVMSAVEMRRPFLVAANTGLSAWIAGSGRIVQQTGRLEPAYIIAQPRLDSRWGMTQLWSDAPAWCMALICLISTFTAIVAWRYPKP
ncbi:MAG: apolipoprotein N-acyltransferase [Pirellulaceae bacterium]|nr:apolipoprotein N-acyltransferase [Pirellulaceae bacterium]